MVFANGADQSTFLQVAPNAWGGSAAGYNAQGTQDDRHLQVYKTAVGETAYMIARFSNATHRTLTTLPLPYDFESSWIHAVATTNRAGGFTVGFHTNAAALTWMGMEGAFHATVSGS